MRRVARRTGKPTETDVPGFLFMEIDGLALPVLRRAIRDGNVPNMAGWLAAGKLKTKEDIRKGLETFPATLLELFSGGNDGKLILEV